MCTRCAIRYLFQYDIVSLCMRCANMMSRGVFAHLQPSVSQDVSGSGSRAMPSSATTRDMEPRDCGKREWSWQPQHVPNMSFTKTGFLDMSLFTTFKKKVAT